MKKGKKILVYVLLALALVLSACGSSETVSSAFQDAELDDNGDIVIRETDISTDATFINYDVDGVTVQFIAVQDSSGAVRLGYNTCQSCSPSPRAYFAQDGDRLVCQNCGLSFSAENVGAGGYGCNPAAVTDAVRAEGTITVPASGAAAMAGRFANWQGPTA